MLEVADCEQRKLGARKLLQRMMIVGSAVVGLPLAGLTAWQPGIDLDAPTVEAQLTPSDALNSPGANDNSGGRGEDCLNRSICGIDSRTRHWIPPGTPGNAIAGMVVLPLAWLARRLASRRPDSEGDRCKRLSGDHSAHLHGCSRILLPFQ